VVERKREAPDAKLLVRSASSNAFAAFAPRETRSVFAVPAVGLARPGWMETKSEGLNICTHNEAASSLTWCKTKSSCTS
jgi:hypothetical protein